MYRIHRRKYNLRNLGVSLNLSSRLVGIATWVGLTWIGVNTAFLLVERDALEPSNDASRREIWNTKVRLDISDALATPEVIKVLGSNAHQTGVITEKVHSEMKFFSNWHLITKQGYRELYIPVEGDKTSGTYIARVNRQSGRWVLSSSKIEVADITLELI